MLKLQGLTFCFLMLNGFMAWAAPMTFNTALPVADDEFLMRFQSFVRQSGNDPSTLDRDLKVKAFVTVLGYGVSSKLALFGVLPYLDKEMRLSVNNQRWQRNTNGLGDLTLFGCYIVYQQNQLGQTFRIAPLVGVKVPTGEDQETDALGELPQPFQLGTGSWDFFAGMVSTYQTLDYQFDTQLSYRINTEANNFEAGNEARWDMSLQYRLWPSSIQHGFLYAVMESNLIYRYQNRINGYDDPNSGGLSLLLAPGIQYVTKRWIVETVVQRPVVQNLDGVALENDYTFWASVRFNF